MAARTLVRAHAAVRDDIGELITRRPLPVPGLELLDPFLFLNHHGPQVYPPMNRGLPFGPHPHRGFETVTFIQAGDLLHTDSGGHASDIRGGGVQWMTAGRGLVHAELSSDEFRRNGGPLEILQLWVNLPARLKMTAPRYVGLQREEIPSYEASNGQARVNLVSGEWRGHTGPIASLTDVHASTVELRAGAELGLPAPEGRTVFLYTVRGEVDLAGGRLPEHHLAELSDTGDHVTLTAASDAVLLYLHAAPLREPVVAHGPFVMNTVEEIQQAIRDFQAGSSGPLP
jgi:hypothetical protein